MNKNYRSGLVSVSFRQNSPREILEAMTSAGLSEIEWGSDVHAPCDDDAKLSEIVELMKEYHVTCSSYGTYFRLGETDTAELHGYIDAAERLSTNILRIWCGSKNFEDMSPEEIEHLISEGKKAAEIAEKRGAVICAECHNKTITNRLDGALFLMSSVDSPAFRMYWQPNQFRTEEENLEYAEKISKYVKVIHVFNWEGKNKYPLKDSIEIWKKYFSLFDGSQALLLEFMPDGLIETLKTEAEALKKITEA